MPGLKKGALGCMERALYEKECNMEFRISSSTFVVRIALWINKLGAIANRIRTFMQSMYDEAGRM